LGSALVSRGITGKIFGVTGIPASDLADDDLDRDLAHLHETRRETFLHGGEESLNVHTSRMLELETEFRRRFPERVAPDPARLRATSHL
jgi:hypothetical protein